MTHDHTVANQQVSYGHPQHHTATVVAEVLDQNGEPLAGVDLVIEIVGGPNATGEVDEQLTTGADGSVTWSYSGKVRNGEGTDTVRVTVLKSDLVEERTMTWKWHPCDNPDEGMYLVLPIGGGVDQSYTIGGTTIRTVICWGHPHQHDE